jgi:threonine/homoserine/homoserine lactone efflux protein
MNLTDWLLFLGVASVAIVLPGPAALLCINHGVRHGCRRTLATVFGGTLSALVLMCLSALGLWRLLDAAPLGYELVRACGVAWLVLLGVNTWRSAHLAVPSGQPGCSAVGRRSLAALCRDGFLLGIGNPKDLLFFGALLPQFIDPQAPRLPQLATLFFTWALVDGVAMGAYAALGERLLRWLGSPARLRFFHRTSGALLMAAAVLLGVARSGAAG